MTAELVTKDNSPYGAQQLKRYIEFSTYRAFALTNLLLIIIFLAGWLVVSKQKQNIFSQNGSTVIEVIPFDYHPQAPVPTAQPKGTSFQNTETNVSGGNPVLGLVDIVREFEFDPNALYNPDPVSNPGTGPVVENNFGKGPFTEPVKQPLTEETEFVAVDKEPAINLADLNKLVIYPEIAKKAGLSGKVLLKVLVDAHGKAEEILVLSSQYDILSEAAITAVRKANFTPAQQNGENIRCWLIVPIDFRLK